MYALNIENCSKTYPNGLQALNNVSLQVKPGDFFGLLGPNGAGKTTLISIVSSLIMQTSGEVSVFGHNIKSQRYAAQSCIGLVPQEFNMNWHLKVRQIVEIHAGYFGVPRKIAKARAEHYLKMLGLWDKRDGNARSLSGGMKRRLMIARAMMHQPKLVLLDEPTAGVDVELRHATWECLKELNANGATIILTTHNLEEAEQLCQNLAVINHGKLIQQGSIDDLIAKMQQEKFMVETIELCPETLQLPTFTGQKVATNTLEFTCLNQAPLQELFHGLSENNLTIQRIWKKSSRLEEVFLGLLKQDKGEDDA